ncbi:hypothetical protein ElyMa_000451700, partial [Elysia marginata]
VDGMISPPPPSHVSADCLDGVDPLKPPPLPQKKRSPSASTDLLDSLSSAVSGRSKPPLLNSSVSLDHSLASAGQQQMPVIMRAMLSGPASLNGNSIVSTTSVSSSSSSSSSSSFSTSSCSTTQQQQQQHSQSHVVVQQSSSKTVTSQQTFSRTVSDSKLSSSSSSTSRKGKTFDEINQLTDQIKELTNTIQETPPPLPAKKSSMQRLNSQYDNIPETIESRLAALSSTSSTSSSSFSSHQRTTVVMRKEGRVSSSSSSSSQSSYSNQ